jgi:beta-1,2-xylosyltransferase
LTGAFHRDRYDWRASQRHRLSHLVGNTTEEAEAVVLLDRSIGNASSSDGGLEVGTWKENDLIEKWMNVGLVKGVSVPSLSLSLFVLYDPSD